MDAIDAILKAGDLVAVLGREVTVRLIDISVSGCLVESSSRLALGTMGSLLVMFDSQEYLDDVRIIRCRELEGSGGGYQIGAEFLWTTPPGERSLRRIVNRLTGAVRVEPSGSSGWM
jgi:PilZ domain